MSKKSSEKEREREREKARERWTERERETHHTGSGSESCNPDSPRGSCQRFYRRVHCRGNRSAFLRSCTTECLRPRSHTQSCPQYHLLSNQKYRDPKTDNARFQLWRTKKWRDSHCLLYLNSNTALETIRKQRILFQTNTWITILKFTPNISIKYLYIKLALSIFMQQDSIFVQRFLINKIALRQKRVLLKLCTCITNLGRTGVSERQSSVHIPCPRMSDYPCLSS